uniref:Uncharacterized protein n=1 Tax=Trichobilharzia regenti TaxID=157069 RepID=A0AA85J7T7_TRIRE|nr:unnamed protein product [Trichobilharzia regenti]
MDEYLKNYFNKFIKIIHFLIQNEHYQKEIDVYTKKLCKKVTSSPSNEQSPFNEVKFTQQENNNVFPYCFGILTEKIQNNSTSLRPKRDVVRYVLDESQTMNSGITSRLPGRHKLKKTDHQAHNERKKNGGLQTIQQKNATTALEEASTALDANSNKKHEASTSKAGLFSAIAASTPKSEKKSVKEKDTGKGVASMKKPTEAEDDHHEEDSAHVGKEKNLLKRFKKQKSKQPKQSPTDNTEITTGDQDDIHKKVLGKSRLFKSDEEDKNGKHKNKKHTADHDDNDDDDDDGGDNVSDDEIPSEHDNKRKTERSSKIQREVDNKNGKEDLKMRSHLLKSSHDEKDKKKRSKPDKDADVDEDTRRVDKAKSHKEKKEAEEEAVKGDVDDQRKHTVKLSKKRQKRQDDEGDEDAEDKEHTKKHHDTAYDKRKRRRQKFTSSYVDSDEDDIHDEEHSMKRKMTKAKTRGKHKVSPRSRYDSSDDNDDDDDVDQRDDFDDDEERKHKTHRKPDRKIKDKFKSREKHEFSHKREDKKHTKKRHTEKGYKSSSDESSSEDSFSYSKHEKQCKCGCTASHDTTSLRIHCHPDFYRDYRPSHRRQHEYLCHVKESPPAYLHQCKDTEEDDDILGTLEQICSDRRRHYKERCCTDSSRRKRWNRHNKSVDLKRYLSPQTVKLLKAVEKPSTLDGLSMTRLEKKLKQRLPMRSKADLTLIDRDDCYRCNTNRELSDNIPHNNQVNSDCLRPQQLQPNTYQNPTNMPAWCPPVLPVLSPPRVLVKQIPVPVVLPQCTTIPTNQSTVYPYPMPPTNPNYFNPSVAQQMPHYAVPPYCQYP